jgi:hypothetical protein
MRRSSANVLASLDGRRVARRLRLLAGKSDVLALQEWPRRRAGLLHDLRRWTFHRPLLGGGPIGVRDELGETALSCKAKILKGPGFVGRSPGRKSRAVLGPSYATRLKTKRADDSIVVRYNIHLTAGVQAGKAGYRTDAASSRRVARHRSERDRLEWLVDRDHARGYDVEVYGDTNFHHMPIAGLVGWWLMAPDVGTFGNRAIDGIWTDDLPSGVAFLPPLVRGEHRHVTTSSPE